MSTTYPSVTIKNDLSASIQIFDAFQNNEDDKSLANFFGTLTPLVTVPAGGSQEFTPIHGPISTFIVFDDQNNPLTRFFTLGTQPASFEVQQSDVDTMNTTEAFIKLMQDQPDNPEVVQFQALIKNGKATAAQVNQFFQSTTDYKTVTFVTYMLAVVALARTPQTQKSPPQDQVYSLSTLVNYFGFSWPSSIPDVTISHFNCNETDTAIFIGGELNITDVTFDSGVLGIIQSFIGNPTIDFGVEFVYNDGLATGMTCLKFSMDEVKIPIGGGNTFDIDKPTMLLSLNPLFKFVVFEIKATIPFNLFGSPEIDADIAMTIDNIEAEIGVNLRGNTTSLLTPPGIKGLHFDSFGLGLGVIFEPPGFAIGLEGTFHIGDQGQVPLTDDNFAVVCEMEEEIPNPLYVAFYVPKLDFNEIITLFTNTSYNIDLPVSFTDLSFRWAENPMEPVVLPDGSLAPMGYGFNAVMDLFGLQFYGYLQIDLNTGVHGTITMAPLNFGTILSITGDGKGASIKVDQNGNPIPINAVPKTKLDQQTIKNATDKTVVSAGGPEMSVSTSSSPYFTLDAAASLFGLVNDKIDAVIANDGISFEMDYGAILETKMACKLADYHNFSGAFSYGLDFDVSLPSIAGFSLGSIHLDAGCAVSVALNTSASEISFQVSGGFNFEGLNLNFGPFEADLNISSISGLLSAIETYIVQNASSIFQDIINDAEKWAGYVKNAIVNGVSDVAQGLKQAYNKTAAETANIMNSVGYSASTIASDIGNAFSYSATEVAQAMEEGYGATSQVVAEAFQEIGIGAQDTAQALNTVFGLAPDAVRDVMLGVGYADDAIKSAFESIGGAFASAASSIWHAVSHWDHWS